MHRFYPQSLVQGLWTKLDDLFNENKVISHEIVFNEICHDEKKLDELGKWVKPKERYFKRVTQRQTELLLDILKNFPKLIDHKSTKDQADPWLIALLLEERELLQNQGKNFLMVCNESKNSPDKIPAACKHYSIQVLGLTEFIQYNDWKIAVS